MTTSLDNTNCLVCSAPSNGICCQACATFFHRSIKERRKYTCQRGQNCRISNDHGLRNSCRACRLKKCLEIGMEEEKKKGRKVASVKNFSPTNQMQQEHYQNGFISLCPLQNALPTTSIIIHNNVAERQNSISIPLTLQFEESIRQYDNGLRAFSIVEGISTELVDTKPARLITQHEFSRADRAAALLIYAMICQQLPILRELTLDYRIKMLKEFCKQFVTFHRIHMTTPKFCESTPTFVFIVPGGAIDRNLLTELFAENDKEKEKICISMMERLIEFGKYRVCPLKIGQLEFAALSGILFWNTVEKHLLHAISFDQIRAQKDAFYGELFAIISDKYGSLLPHQSIIIHHSKLLELLHQLNLLISDVDEMQIMAKIFMNLPDFWDELNLPPDPSHKQIDNSFY